MHDRTYVRMTICHSVLYRYVDTIAFLSMIKTEYVGQYNERAKAKCRAFNKCMVFNLVCVYHPIIPPRYFFNEVIQFCKILISSRLGNWEKREIAGRRLSQLNFEKTIILFSRITIRLDIIFFFAGY